MLTGCDVRPRVAEVVRLKIYILRRNRYRSGTGTGGSKLTIINRIARRGPEASGRTRRCFPASESASAAGVGTVVAPGGVPPLDWPPPWGQRRRSSRSISCAPQLRCDSLSSWRAAASKHQPPGRGPPNSQRRRQPRYGVPRVVGAPPRRICTRPDALQPAASSSRQQLLCRAALLSACAPTHAGEQLIRACNRTRPPGSLPLADASCT